MPTETIYVLQNQSLFEQAFPVFVGAFVAFLFSVLTLFIANRINAKNTRRQLLKNLSRELRYDLSVIADIKKALDVTIQKVLADEERQYLNVKYTKFLSVFVQKAYRTGVLFELLGEYDLAVFDDVVNRYGGNNGSQPWLQGKLEDLDKGNLTKNDVVKTLQFEKETLDTHTRVISDVLSKIEQGKK